MIWQPDGAIDPRTPATESVVDTCALDRKRDGKNPEKDASAFDAKMKAALDGCCDPSLVIIGRTGAVSITGLDDAVARAKAYEATGVDALFFTGIKSSKELEALAAATRLPIVLGGAPEEMAGLDYLISQRVRIALQGHAPFAAATQAVYETLKALREGASPGDLKGLAPPGLTSRAMREAEAKARSSEFLGLKK